MPTHVRTVDHWCKSPFPPSYGPRLTGAVKSDDIEWTTEGREKELRIHFCPLCGKKLPATLKEAFGVIQSAD